MTTYLIDIPQVFAIDHDERDLPTGEQVKVFIEHGISRVGPIAT